MKYKYSLVDGQRQEAQPSLSGRCQVCDAPMAAKCGKIKVWHWAHLSKLNCDSWWENKTEWHRAWQGQFPLDWQEIVHTAKSGEKHIADVKTDQGWVLEFQHSPIDPEERQSRNNFYQQVVWVVDGTSRKRDEAQFFKALNNGIQIVPKVPLQKLRGSSMNVPCLGNGAVAINPYFLILANKSILGTCSLRLSMEHPMLCLSPMLNSSTSFEADLRRLNF